MRQKRKYFRVIVLMLLFWMTGCARRTLIDDDNIDFEMKDEIETTSKDVFGVTDMLNFFEDEKLFKYQETAAGEIEITGLTELGMEKEKLTVPNKINSKQVSSIAEYAFFDCTWIEEISLPESIKKIGKNAFLHCDNIKGNIPLFGFYEKDDGTICITGFTNEKDETILVIPEKINGKTVTEIGDSAFDGSSIEEVYFPLTLEKIARGAFRNCYFLKGVGMPESLTYLGEEAFKECYSLESVSLNSALEVIPAHCFARCKKLFFVGVPEGVKRIEANVFLGTDSLHFITIPASVEYISEYAFSKNVFWEYFVTIVTSEGSYAEQYAKDNRIKVFLE